MPGSFSNVMVDLETTGIDPSHNHIIQVSAVRFNLDEKTIDVDDMFDRCLFDTVPNRYWDQSTQTWWQNQPDVLDSICMRMENPAEVMKDFEYWLSRTPATEPVMLWAKPISFEWPFIQSYFRQFRLTMPCHYRHAKDVNTYIWGRGHKDIDAFWNSLEFQGDRHNAIFDVIHQIQGVFNA